jgi:hypothetical protein
MKLRAVTGAALAAAVALALAGCDRNALTGGTSSARAPASAPRPDTAVLGGYGNAPPAAPALPAPPIPITARASLRMAQDGPDSGLAMWIDLSHHVNAARWTRATGWQPAQTLETIRGDASEVAIGANAGGVAMAVWRHTLGEVESLRWSRYVASEGWSTPDVLPGALPRRHVIGEITKTQPPAAPRIVVDDQGNAYAEWASGFASQQLQSARFAAGQGWSKPQDLAWNVPPPVAAASAATPSPR